jgi:hypothetical protein
MSAELERLTVSLEALRDRWLRAESPTALYLAGDQLRDLLRRAENPGWRARARATCNRKSVSPRGITDGQ